MNEASLRQQLAQEANSHDMEEDLIFSCYILKKEIGEDITDEYPYIRYVYLLKALNKDYKEQAKAMNKK